MARRLIVEIIGDSASYERALKRSQAAGTQFNTNIGRSALKGAAALTGITGATLLLTDAVRASAQEFAQHAKVTAQTEAVLKSTGGVANATAKQISDLADEVLRYSGIDDEAVQSAENLLLTFRHVRNEVGQGNDVFNRATKAAVDLSVAGFGSLDSTAKQLGKALEDPVRGMTALRRAGVTFSQSQQDTIKSLVESGRVLEAQKLILAEVETQVGGSAQAFGKTLPGQLSIAQQSLRNLGGDLAGTFAPAVGDAATAVVQLADGVRDLKSALDSLPGASKLKDLLDRTVGAMPEWAKLLSPLGPVAFLFGNDAAASGGLAGPQGLGLPRPPGPAGPQTGRGRTTLRPFALPLSLRIGQARAAVTGGDAELASARQIAAYIRHQIATGRLSGDRLVSALGELATAQGVIRSAMEDEARKRKDASEKEADARKRHAEAVKRAAERQRQAAQEAARKLDAATDQARTEIGQLFSGPVLAPTEFQRKLALGVPGPDASKILADIRGQNQQAVRFERDLRRLRGLGVGGSTVDELRGLGTGAIPQIEAILGARGGTRHQLVNALLARERTAQRIGQMIVHTPVVHLNAARVTVRQGSGRAQGGARSGRFAGQ